MEEALKRYYVANEITELIVDDYNYIQMKMTLGNTVAARHKLEKEIIGCTISAILFALAMYMLIKASEVECRGPTTRSCQRQSLI